MDKIYVTPEGMEKMEADLAEMYARQPIIVAEIEHARSYGDLRENAEYHAAKESLARLEALIADLEDKMARAQVLDSSKVDRSKAYQGATVRVLNKRSNKEVLYTLVSQVEADPLSGKISVQSPVGEALAGASEGDTVLAQTPAGELQLEVLEITWQE